MPLSPAHATRLLARVSEGDHGAADELLPLIYGELRRIAGERMGHERANHTLQPTELVNEVWLRVFWQ